MRIEELYTVCLTLLAMVLWVLLAPNPLRDLFVSLAGRGGAP